MARELTARAIEADVLFITIDQNGQKIIIHIEFQTHSQEPDPFERDGFAEMGWYLLVFSTGSPDQSQPERIVWI